MSEEWNRPARQIENRRSRQRDTEMENEAERRRQQTSAEGRRAQQTARYRLQNANGWDAPQGRKSNRIGNIKRAGDRAAEEDCGKGCESTHGSEQGINLTPSKIAASRTVDITSLPLGTVHSGQLMEGDKGTRPVSMERLS